MKLNVSAEGEGVKLAVTVKVTGTVRDAGVALVVAVKTTLPL